MSGVQRIGTFVNAVGGATRALGVPDRLSEDAVLRAAQRKTGLSDFGDDRFRTPLRMLIRAYNEDSRLTCVHRLTIRLWISRALVNRLLITDELKRHPEILSLSIRRPIVVASLPRTGTTFLHRLLAQDPHARALLGWEVLEPVPRRLPDTRRKRARRIAKFVRMLLPGSRAIHTFEPEGPEECSMLLRNTFVFAAQQAPTYREWYVRQPDEVIEASYREYRQQLQILQWQRPHEGHWVLKSGVHPWGIGALLRIFPDAAIVLIHRDPHSTIASICSGASYAVADRGEDLAVTLLNWVDEGLQRVEASRAHAAPSRIYDMPYQDLVSDPLGAVQRLYAHFGYPYTPEFETRATTWLKEHPQHKHGKHRYSLERFGLGRRMIADRFSWYCERYQIPPERESGS